MVSGVGESETKSKKGPFLYFRGEFTAAMDSQWVRAESYIVISDEKGEMGIAVFPDYLKLILQSLMSATRELH